MPIDQYVGGVENAILHLMYSRFFTKVLHDMGLVDFTEPFRALLNQGSVILDGKAMSKSLGNMVDLGDELGRFGVDAIRLTMLFAGPPEDDVDWADVSPSGSVKYLARAWRAVRDAAAGPEGLDESLAKPVAKTVDEVTRLTEGFRFNVAVARLMELTSALRKAIDAGLAARDGAAVLAVLLAPFAPFLAEQAWAELGHDVGAGDSVHLAAWPVADPALLVEDAVTCIVQVGGKLRARLEVAADIAAGELEKLALAAEPVQRSLDGLTVRKVIVRAPKLVNIVAN
jgi:leucyl-tRNA synthetase